MSRFAQHHPNDPAEPKSGSTVCTWCAPETFVQNWKARIFNGFDYHVCTVLCTRKQTPTNPKTRTKTVG
ncbi:hypothetical protein GAY29_21255 [Azospirillum brasilense]|nr:hypothetical protein [Azospirillum brasilense]